MLLPRPQNEISEEALRMQKLSVLLQAVMAFAAIGSLLLVLHRISKR